MQDHRNLHAGFRFRTRPVAIVLTLCTAALLLSAAILGPGGDGRSAAAIAAEAVDPALDGRRVRVSGWLESGQILRDPVLGVSADAVALIREVEMYQWQETFPAAGLRRRRGNPDAAGAPRYRAVWSARRIASEKFRAAGHYRNPRTWPLRATAWRAGQLRLGAFRPDPALVDIGAGGAMRQRLPLGVAHLDGLPPELRARATDRQPDWLYIGDPLMPEIGDLRVRVYALPAQRVTVTAIQRGDRLQAAPAGTGMVWHGDGG